MTTKQTVNPNTKTGITLLLASMSRLLHKEGQTSFVYGILISTETEEQFTSVMDIIKRTEELDTTSKNIYAKKGYIHRYMNQQDLENLISNLNAPLGVLNETELEFEVRNKLVIDASEKDCIKPTVHTKWMSTMDVSLRLHCTDSQLNDISFKTNLQSILGERITYLENLKSQGNLQVYVKTHKEQTEFDFIEEIVSSRAH